MPVSPWLLWGGSEALNCPYTGIFTTTVASRQLNKISYGRPDTWHWLFSVAIVGTTYAVLPTTVGQQLQVFFDLTIGIGRSQVTLPAFEHYTFTAAAGDTLDGQIWSTTAVGPDRGGVLVNSDNLVRQIVAQDIQLQCRAVYSTGETHGDSVRIQVDTHFAPVNHIRPEWYRGEFPGHEDHGQ